MRRSITNRYQKIDFPVLFFFRPNNIVSATEKLYERYLKCNKMEYLQVEVLSKTYKLIENGVSREY